MYRLFQYRLDTYTYNHKIYIYILRERERVHNMHNNTEIGGSWTNSNLEVSKSSILIGCSITNHPAGYPHWWKPSNVASAPPGWTVVNGWICHSPSPLGCESPVHDNGTITQGVLHSFTGVSPWKQRWSIRFSESVPTHGSHTRFSRISRRILEFQRWELGIARDCKSTIFIHIPSLQHKLGETLNSPNEDVWLSHAVSWHAQCLPSYKSHRKWDQHVK